MQTEIIEYSSGPTQQATLSTPGGRRKADCPLVVICRGGGAAWSYAMDDQIDPFWGTPKSPSNFRSSIAMLVNEGGYAVLCLQAEDPSLSEPYYAFGNDVSTTHLNNVIGMVQALDGISSGKIALAGFSMGNVTMLNHARRQGQTNIAGMLGICPLNKLSVWRGLDADSPHSVSYAAINQAFYTAGTPGTVNDTKWTTEILPTFDPLSIAASITVPYGLWGNSDDILCPPNDLDDMAALVTSSLVDRRNLRSQTGHNLNGVRGDDLLSWLDQLPW